MYSIPCCRRIVSSTLSSALSRGTTFSSLRAARGSTREWVGTLRWAMPVETWITARQMSFSFPGPRKLQDITNLPLLEKEPSEKISEIWAAYHDERVDTFGTCLPGDALTDLQKRATKCPMFVIPVWRDGGHFMVLSQFQDSCFLLTFLEDYKLNPAGAAPYATVSLYDDLIVSKGLGLVRADITPNLAKKEVARLVRLLLRFYSPHAHHHVETFNLRPQEFDLEKLLKEIPRE